MSSPPIHTPSSPPKHSSSPVSPPIEATLLIKRQAYVFPLPPRTRADGYKAMDWDPNKAWIGRLRVIQVTYSSPTHATNHLGPNLARSLIHKPQTNPPVNKPWSLLIARFEDSVSNELFGECFIRDGHTDVERVLDSSRYFVVKLTDRTSGRSAFAGFGFQDRADAFDWNVTVQDFSKLVNYELGGCTTDSSDPSSISQVSIPTSTMDFSLKEGQTIKLNLGNLAKKFGDTKSVMPSSNTSTTTSENVSSLSSFFPPPPAPGPSSVTETSFDNHPFEFSHFKSGSLPVSPTMNKAMSNIHDWASFAPPPSNSDKIPNSTTSTIEDTDPFAAFK